MHPVRAAVVALVANTAPVAFGAMGTPVVTLAQVTGLPLDSVASVVGRQTPLLALVMPLVLVGLVDGRRGLRETWLPALVCGTAFAARPVRRLQLRLRATRRHRRLPGRCGRPRRHAPRACVRPESVRAAVLTGARSEDLDQEDPRPEVLRAYAPYALIVAVCSLARIPAVRDWPAGATRTFDWPFLNAAAPNGKPVGANVFTWPIVSTGGTLVLLAGVGTALVLGVQARVAVREWAATAYELRFAILTVTSVLALAYVMNLSGQAATIGHFVAAAGAGLAFLSPVLGWFGVASPDRTPRPTPSSAPSRSAPPTSRACRPNCLPLPTVREASSAR